MSRYGFVVSASRPEVANDKFDPEKNTICVSLTPRVEQKKAVAKMKTENLTDL